MRETLHRNRPVALALWILLIGITWPATSRGDDKPVTALTALLHEGAQAVPTHDDYLQLMPKAGENLFEAHTEHKLIEQVAGGIQKLQRAAQSEQKYILNPDPKTCNKKKIVFYKITYRAPSRSGATVQGVSSLVLVEMTGGRWRLFPAQITSACSNRSGGTL